MSNSIKSVLMRRDALTENDAREAVDELISLANDMISEGAGLSELEQLLMDEVGLEPDYIFDILNY